jgi:hypothetical protein
MGMIADEVVNGTGAITQLDGGGEYRLVFENDAFALQQVETPAAA